MNQNSTLELLESMTKHFSKALEGFHSRIAALEKEEGITILDHIDPAKEYRVGQLAKSRNGLFQKTADGWVNVVNAVDTVAVGESAEGTTLYIHQSDGTTLERTISKAKARKKLTAMPVKLAS